MKGIGQFDSRTINSRCWKEVGAQILYILLTVKVGPSG